MSDWSDGFDFSDLWTSGQDLPSGGIDFGNYNPYDPGGPGGGNTDTGYGYNDRGLGTDGGGTLTPGQINQLGGGSSLGNIAGGSPSGANGQRGIFTNGDGSPNWASILGVLGPILGGAYTANQTGKANQQMQDSIKQANAQITSTLGSNAGLFQPYRDVGAIGLDRLKNMPQSNLASRYRPLGAGNGFSLGNIAKGQ